MGDLIMVFSKKLALIIFAINILFSDVISEQAALNVAENFFSEMNK